MHIEDHIQTYYAVINDRDEFLMASGRNKFTKNYNLAFCCKAIPPILDFINRSGLKQKLKIGEYKIISVKTTTSFDQTLTDQNHHDILDYRRLKAFEKVVVRHHEKSRAASQYDYYFYEANSAFIQHYKKYRNKCFFAHTSCLYITRCQSSNPYLPYFDMKNVKNIIKQQKIKNTTICKTGSVVFISGKENIVLAKMSLPYIASLDFTKDFIRLMKVI